jgi:NADH:ubiquinone oxidoreductase subunit 3 (subunit A)
MTGFSSIFVFILVSFLLASVLFAASFLLVPRQKYLAKTSAYECGFDPFEDTRAVFDVRFYLVAILFIIFDIEIAFLFPWATVLGHIGNLGFFSMVYFLFLLTLGFFYEWNSGALDWQ